MVWAAWKNRRNIADSERFGELIRSIDSWDLLNFKRRGRPNNRSKKTVIKIK